MVRFKEKMNAMANDTTFYSGPGEEKDNISSIQ
jgi:hypothetical protein